MRTRRTALALLLGAAGPAAIVRAAPPAAGRVRHGPLAPRQDHHSTHTLPDPACFFSLVTDCDPTPSTTSSSAATTTTTAGDASASSSPSSSSTTSRNFTFIAVPPATFPNSGRWSFPPLFTITLHQNSSSTTAAAGVATTTAAGAEAEDDDGAMTTTTGEPQPSPTTTVDPFLVFPPPPPDDVEGEGDEPQGTAVLGCHDGTFTDGNGRVPCDSFTVYFGLHSVHEVLLRADNFQLEDRVRCEGDRWKSIKSPLPWTLEVRGGDRCDPDAALDADSYEGVLLSYASIEALDVQNDVRCRPAINSTGRRCILPQRP